MQVEPLIDQIYEAAVVPDRWPAVLESLGQRFRTKGSLLFAVSTEGTKWLGGGEVTELMREFLAAGWMAHNTRPQLAVERNHPGFLTDLDLLTEEQTQTLPVYTEFLNPRGLVAAAGTFVPGLEDQKLILSVEGFRDHGAARAAVPELDTLRPHLARAAWVAGQLRLERLKGYVEALERIGCAACVINSRGRLQAANQRIQPELGTALLDRGERLRLADPSADALLAQALGEIAAGHGGGRSIPLRSSQAPDLARVLHVLPVRGEAHDLFLDASAVLILVDPHRQVRVPVGLMRTLFDLTPAESKLASRLAGGASLQQVADETGVSVNTLRWQLKSVFAKTGSGSQAELARLLVSVSTF